MKCPFCAEEIKDAAIVCRYCHRDLTIVRPIYEVLRAQGEEIRDLRRDLDAFGPGDRELPGQPATWGISPAPRPILAAFAFLLPFVCMVFAHYLIVIAFDWPVLVLRIVSIAVPLVFAVSTPGLPRLGWPGLILLAACLGVLSVLAMSWVVAVHDHVPVFPTDARGWREDLEYATSIALGLVTGVLVAQAYASLRAVAMQLWTAEIDPDNVRSHISKTFPRLELVSTVFTVVAPVVTGVAAVYTGIRALLP